MIEVGVEANTKRKRKRSINQDQYHKRNKKKRRKRESTQEKVRVEKNTRKENHTVIKDQEVVRSININKAEKIEESKEILMNAIKDKISKKSKDFFINVVNSDSIVLPKVMRVLCLMMKKKCKNYHR